MINNLPLDILNEIKTFLIPPSNRIIFTQMSANSYVSSYSSRYENAFIGNTIEVEYNDSVIEMNYYEYKSKYVGKNIDDALLHLILLV